MISKGGSLFIILVGLILISFVEGKERTVYKVSEQSKFIVEGTSTLHDWEMISSDAKGKGAFVIKNDEVQHIKSLHVALKGETLKSGKKGMDENAYKALKTDDHPVISFKLDKVVNEDEGVMTLKGEFCAGGTTKTEIIKVIPKCENGKVTLLGRFDITFTEYNMEPPSALMGTVKTGNELTISFKTIFNQ